ncbi:MAG: methionine--tRNA ligase [Pseudomonadota bacterium]
MTDTQRRILVTSALPYANGPIHIGHLVEYIQTDIWARFQRMRGHECIYVCADDAHGTPIMLRAEAEGVTPEQLIARVEEEHRRDFAAFGVSFDLYYTTHSPENRELAELIYTRLRDDGHIAVRTIRQSYDAEKEMFLPDRYVKGNCPRCDSPDQYGDSCEVCGATYSPTDLKDPISVVSGSTPELRESEHHFVKLGDFDAMLREWVHDENARPVQPGIANKLEEWFETGLQDWDISRDAPYFGFEIPEAPGKYFYVWLDAPIGYMAAFKHLCDNTEGLEFDDFWAPDSDAEVHHFIGKDIAYFHTLFWPAQLHGAGFRKPTAVHCHGFLTVNNQKMSKSRGTFVKAETFARHLSPEQLRYYFACKLGNGIDDLDLNLEDFSARVNADLVGKVVNIASRCAGFITRRFHGQLAVSLPDPALYARLVDAAEGIAGHYEAREFGRAMRDVMALADQANQYIDAHKPWQLAKDPGRLPEVQAICTQGLNLFRVLMTYLAPVLPETAAASARFLGEGSLNWATLGEPLLGQSIAPFERLMERVDDKAIARMLEDTAADAAAEAAMTAGAAARPELESDHEPVAETIDFDQFATVDLRVARIIAANAVEGADKLLELRVDLGFEQRTVFAGIKAAYDPATLIDRHVVVVANLAARKMRFGVSEGMVLAAGPGGDSIWLLDVDDGASPGLRVR